MRDEARESGCPDPVYEATSFFSATFYPNPEVRAKAALVSGPPIGQVTGEVTGEVHRLIAVMESEMKRQEIQAALGLKHEDHFRETYLVPALKAGVVEMTIPEKPRSSKQRYRITSKGREIQRKLTDSERSGK